jgi:CyaY protein
LLGNVSGPRCPQAARVITNAAITELAEKRKNAIDWFTIKITILVKTAWDYSMTESEFLMSVDRTLTVIETRLELAADVSELDVECTRSGSVLEIEFIESASKIIVNGQAPMQELWVAARSGGYHYKHEAGHWLNTRDGTELFSALSGMVSAQSGVELSLEEE